MQTNIGYEPTPNRTKPPRPHNPQDWKRDRKNARRVVYARKFANLNN